MSGLTTMTSLFSRKTDTKYSKPLWPSSYVTLGWNYSIKKDCHIFDFFSKSEGLTPTKLNFSVSALYIDVYTL